MYTVPSYVTYRTEEDAIYITSELYRNTVRLTDHGLQKEFINLTRCGGCAELNTPLTRYLHEQELLVTEEELDHALHQVRSLLDNIFMVTLMPTEGCNFRCPYCYEDHHAVSMTRDTLDRIEEYITAQAPRYKQVILAWFGGEPTLCKDTFVLLVTGAVKASTVYPSFIRIQKMCWSQSMLHIWIRSGCCVITTETEPLHRCATLPIHIAWYSGPMEKLANALWRLTTLKTS